MFSEFSRDVCMSFARQRSTESLSRADELLRRTALTGLSPSGDRGKEIDPAVEVFSPKQFARTLFVESRHFDQARPGFFRHALLYACVQVRHLYAWLG